MLSKRKRCAFVSTGPRSLIATTSMSLRPDSKIARSTSRPIRPKPLIATLATIAISPLAPGRGRLTTQSVEAALIVQSPAQCPEWNWRRRGRAPCPRSGAKLAERRLDHRLGRDAEMLIDGFIWAAFAEALHADEWAVADDRVPSEPYRGLDRDLHFGGADDRAAIVLRLLEERREAGHGHDPGRYALLLQLRLRGDSERHFGAGGEDRHFGLTRRGRNLVAALGAHV